MSVEFNNNCHRCTHIINITTLEHGKGTKYDMDIGLIRSMLISDDLPRQQNINTKRSSLHSANCVTNPSCMLFTLHNNWILDCDFETRVLGAQDNGGCGR